MYLVLPNKRGKKIQKMLRIRFESFMYIIHLFFNHSRQKLVRFFKMHNCRTFFINYEKFMNMQPKVIMLGKFLNFEKHFAPNKAILEEKFSLNQIQSVQHVYQEQKSKFVKRIHIDQENCVTVPVHKGVPLTIINGIR